MLKIPDLIHNQYIGFLSNKNIPVRVHNYYIKWLRYYLDYCYKYKLPELNPSSLPHYINKLKEKNQKPFQQKQASIAIHLFYDLIELTPSIKTSLGSIKTKGQNNGNNVSTYITEKSFQKNEKQSNNEKSFVSDVNNSKIKQKWQNFYKKLSDEIQVRHYSPKTLKTYSTWIRSFQYFLKGKDPELLSPFDVKEFLTFLAVQKKVAASSQNQAFNSILFFFRHVLNKEFGKLDGVVRAKRTKYIPVVLSRKEVDSIVKNLSYPYNLIVMMLYGCGLRLFECMNLRVNNFNFDERILTVHDGKGKKDRTVPLPEMLIQELEAHMNRVENLHKIDIDNNYDGAFMMNQLEKKYKNAGKELIWQWFFPAKELTYVPGTRESRRYHIHESHVRKAIRRAVTRAKIRKRATSHTFRHSFASHLLQANYDIRTIQELLGHSDIRTTMIYTHTVKSRTIKELKSPLDIQ